MKPSLRAEGSIRSRGHFATRTPDCAQRQGGDRMTVMTRREEELLDQLIEIAGDAELVRQVIVDLNTSLGKPPEVAEIVREILRRRFPSELREAAPAR